MILRVWDVTLTVSDLERAVDFYGRVLGLPKKYQFPDYAGFDKEPHDTPWGGRIALLVDPDGNRLQLVQIDWHKYFTACAS